MKKKKKKEKEEEEEEEEEEDRQSSSNPVSIRGQLSIHMIATCQKVCQSVGWSVRRSVTLCFLDVPSHLYKRSCPSVRWSVCPSVRRSISPALFSKVKNTHTW